MMILSIDRELRAAGASRLLSVPELEQRMAEVAATGERPMISSSAAGLALLPEAALELALKVARRALLTPCSAIDPPNVRLAVDHLAALIDGRGSVQESAELDLWLVRQATSWSGSARWTLLVIASALNAAILHREKASPIAVGLCVTRALECLVQADRLNTREEAGDLELPRQDKEWLYGQG